MTPSIRLGDLFTDEQIDLAIAIVREGRDVHSRLVEEVVRPAMSRIDEVTGQQNDVDYFAYVVEWAATHGRFT